jgi:hypothetical protein
VNTDPKAEFYPKVDKLVTQTKVKNDYIIKLRAEEALKHLKEIATWFNIKSDEAGKIRRLLMPKTHPDKLKDPQILAKVTELIKGRGFPGKSELEDATHLSRIIASLVEIIKDAKPAA